jgi:hypothetical protein
MKPQAIKLAPRPAQLAAERRRRAAATERADTALAGLLADLPEDAEFVTETLRALIRAASAKAAALVGSPRAIGLLCGAAADVAPAHRPVRQFAAAEALFQKGEG